MLKYEVYKVDNCYLLIAENSFKPNEIAIGTISELIVFDIEDIINFVSKALELVNSTEGEK